MTQKIQAWKKKEVELIKKDLSSYDVIGVVDMTNVPSAQLQKMRSSLKKILLIKMFKSRLIKLAINDLKDSKKGLVDLLPYITGMPALILTKENPFKMAKSLQKSKTKAPAKIGQKAPNDITILAGPTPFTPGPVMGELGQLGLKTMVVEGKISIKEDKIIVKEGEVINSKVASLLSKLKIEPMEIGLNLTAAYESGLIYKKDVLSIDDKVYLQNLKNASLDAIKLAFSIEYPEKSIIDLLIKKSYNEGKSLASYIKFDTNTEVKTESKENIEVKQEEKKDKKITTKQLTEEDFKEQEQKAKEILNKIQEEKMKTANPVKKPEEPKINKGPNAADLLEK